MAVTVRKLNRPIGGRPTYSVIADDVEAGRYFEHPESRRWRVQMPNAYGRCCVVLGVDFATAEECQAHILGAHKPENTNEK